jgi:hypothetical protein
MYNSWLFPLVEGIHLVGMALLVGSIVRGDWSTWRGLAAPREPWLWRGLLMQVVTGPAMAAANVSRYAQNPAFQLKLALLAVALVFHFAVRERYANRASAAASVTLWSLVVVAARAIADFDG